MAALSRVLLDLPLLTRSLPGVCQFLKVRASVSSLKRMQGRLIRSKIERPKLRIAIQVLP